MTHVTNFKVELAFRPASKSFLFHLADFSPSDGPHMLDFEICGAFASLGLCDSLSTHHAPARRAEFDLAAARKPADESGRSVAPRSGGTGSHTAS